MELGNTKPVILSSWPTCKDCLSWSKEHLAIAGGEVVHILSTQLIQQPFESSSTPLRHLETVRVSLFEEKEWPHQELATIQEFSIGEEQSESTIIALDWSFAGLSSHRRSVLAILTSNLVLSFWESNGDPGTWKRTCIVNNFLGKNLTDSSDIRWRKSRRVRAFCWLPPVHAVGASKWGDHHLIVANDCGDLIDLQVSKMKKHREFVWRFSVAGSYKLPKADQILDPQSSSSLFLQRLHESTTISKIECEKWQLGQDLPGSLFQTLRITQAPFGTICSHKIVIKTLSSESLSGSHTVEFEPGASIRSQQLEHQQHKPNEDIFSTSLAPLCSEYDKRYNLQGNYRVRFWGSAYSVDRNVIAACVTLHPSDMIEYTTSATENCTVLFQPYPSSLNPMESQNQSTTPYLRILSFIAEHAELADIVSDLDKKIVQFASAFVRAGFSGNEQLLSWSQRISEQMDIQEMRENGISSTDHDGKQTTSQATLMDTGDESTSNTRVAVSKKTFFIENCDICEKDIAFDGDVSRAKCVQGHVFTRCGLSFMAIQEPGTSKYCSECGIEFLDLAKLETQTGPSLTQALFEEFDVCPYCQGKFRG